MKEKRRDDVSSGAAPEIGVRTSADASSSPLPLPCTLPSVFSTSAMLLDVTPFFLRLRMPTAAPADA